MYKIYTKHGRPPGMLYKLLLIMRLTIVLLILGFLQVSAASFAQRLTLNERNTQLDQVLVEIRKQAGVDFIIKKALLDKARPVTISLNNVPLEEALNSIFAGSGLEFSISGKKVVITERQSNFFERLVAQFQQIDVKGRVVDKEGNGLPGASISVKNGTRSTTSDSNGEFTLSGIEDNAVLIISYVGYQIKEVKATAKLNNIELEESVGELEQVNVTYNTGYQQLSPERTTGSFSRINNEMITRSVSTNILDRIKGMASGVLFDSNLGNTTGFNIRGRSTIFANTNPLIVLDNFPYEGDLSTINPNDIEDITILKDASAASIWGARAGNGVIVLTSKKGKLNRAPVVNFRSDVNIGQKPDLYSQRIVSPSTYIDITRYLFDRGYYDGAIASGFTRLGPVVELLLQKRNDPTLAATIDPQVDLFRRNNLNDDLLKYYYQAPLNQQHSLNVSGGGNMHSYYLSVGYDKNRADAVNTENDRLSIRADNNFSFLNNKLKVNVGINFTGSNSQQSVFRTADVSAYPYLKLADENGNPLRIDRYRTAYIDAAAQTGKLLSFAYEPLAEMNNIGNKNRAVNYLVNPSISYNVLDGLDLSLNYQYLRGQNQGTSINNLETFAARDMINTYSVLETNGLVTRNIPLGAINSRGEGNTDSESGRFAASYQKKWSKHAVTGLASAEIREMVQTNTFQTLYGYNEDTGAIGLVDYIGYYPTLFGSFATIGGSPQETGTTDRFISYLATGSYSYDEKYIISGNIRKDQSNLFGVNANQKGVPLWSAGLAYVLSKEKFFNVDWLPLLKLRITTGYSGNVDRSVSAYLTMMASSSNFFSNPQASLLNPPNADLRWERVRQNNFAVDFSLFGGRISGSMDYYSKYAKDVMGDSPMPPSSGVITYRGNSADLSGQGYDINLATQNVKGKFNWSSNLLFSHNTDEIEVYKVYTGTLGFREKHPFNALFSYKFSGLDPLNGDPMGYLNGAVSKDWAGINRAYNETDYTYHGSAVPTYFGAFRNDFSFGNISLSVNLSYKFGYFFRAASIEYSSLGSTIPPHTDYDLRWQNPGDEVRTTVPSLVYPTIDSRNNFYKNSSVLVEKGDHIRLQDIQLAYTLNRNGKNKLPFQSLKLYSYINNPGILWAANKKGLDPDSQYIQAPTTVALGLNIGF